MSTQQGKPVIDGWFEDSADGPRLIGSRCTKCGTYYFPKQSFVCRNPSCDSQSFEETALSNEGRIWSFTNAGYAPPEPYMAGEDFEPFIIAAVELEHEKLVVLGQMKRGTDIEALSAGTSVKLIIEEIYEDQGESRTAWKWELADA